MRIVKHVNEDGSTWLRFEVNERWFWSALPLELFENESCVVLNNRPYEDYGDCRLRKGNIEFELLHDDLFGNMISTNNPQDVPDLQQLAENILSSIIKSDGREKEKQE